MKTLISENNLALYFGYASDFAVEDKIQEISAAELERANQYAKKEDRQMAIVSKAVLRNLISEVIDKPIDEINFEYGANGKPFIKNNIGLNFSLAHAGDALLIGLSKAGEIGVDLEKSTRKIDQHKLKKLLFSDKEWAWFNQLEDQKKHAALLKFWTCKEAFFKAKGSGLNFGLAQLELAFKDNDVEILATNWDPLEKEQWRLKAFPINDKFCCAIAFHERIKSHSLMYLNDLD